MSSVMRPVGPEDPQVYWKRRLIVGGGALLVLVALWLIFRPSGDPQSEPAPATTTSTPPEASASASPATAETKCADSDIQVLVSTDKDTYSTGEVVMITLSIGNMSEVACQRDVGSGKNEILVTSGGVDVYSSDACREADAEADAEDVVTLEPAQVANVTVKWNGTNTTAGCSGEQKATPGAYDAIGRNGQVKSAKAPFILQ